MNLHFAFEEKGCIIKPYLKGGNAMDYRVAVCDDQQEDRDFGQQCVLAWAQARGFAVEVAQFPTGEAFLFQYEEDRAWDILLLDVEMAQVSGVELAQRIRQEDQALQIVFLTGYSDYIAQGYDVSALHYLLKPVSREKLFAVLDRAAQRLESAQRTLVLELPGELVRVALREIEYVEVRQNYVTVHTGKEAYTVKKPLSAIERELDSRFHTQIANAAQNPMLATITEYITRLTMPSRLETTRKVLAKGEEEIERFVELHRQLLSVIERRQVDEIAATVQDHYIFWKK